MSADNEISVGCQQPSDRMRINTTDLNYTATRKNTSYTTAVSCDLEGRSGVLLMPSGRPTLIGGSADAIRPADSFWLKPLDGSGREGSADANRPADPFWLKGRCIAYSRGPIMCYRLHLGSKISICFQFCSSPIAMASSGSGDLWWAQIVEPAAEITANEAEEAMGAYNAVGATAPAGGSGSNTEDDSLEAAAATAAAAAGKPPTQARKRKKRSGAERLNRAIATQRAIEARAKQKVAIW